MASRPKWRIYYDDGTTWDYKMGLKEMPRYGVAVILQEQEAGGPNWSVLQGGAYYCLEDGYWVIMQHNDVIEHLLNDIPVEHLIMGRAMSLPKFQSIRLGARADRDIGNLP